MGAVWAWNCRRDCGGGDVSCGEELGGTVAAEERDFCIQVAEAATACAASSVKGRRSVSCRRCGAQAGKYMEEQVAQRRP